VHLVVGIGERPVADFMRDLMWRYSRTSWHREAEGRPWFRERYRATLIQVEIYLEALVRYVHYLPVRAGLATHPDTYPYSSHSAYLGRRSGPPVRTRKLLTLVGCHGDDVAPYRRAMAEAPPESLGKLFERGKTDTPGVIGDEHFLSQRPIAPMIRTPPPSTRLIEKLIAQIAERQALSVAEICSRSRRRDLVLARAQIAWLAMRWNLATLTCIARHLHHSPSAMTRAVARYRYTRPDLFTAAPLAPLRQVSYDRVAPRSF